MRSALFGVVTVSLLAAACGGGSSDDGRRVTLELRRSCGHDNIARYVRRYADARAPIAELRFGARRPSGDTIECQAREVVARTSAGSLDLRSGPGILEMTIDGDALQTAKANAADSKHGTCVELVVCEDENSDGACGGVGVESAVGHSFGTYEDITDRMRGYVFAADKSVSAKTNPELCDDIYAP